MRDMMAVVRPPIENKVFPRRQRINFGKLDRFGGAGMNAIFLACKRRPIDQGRNFLFVPGVINARAGLVDEHKFVFSRRGFDAVRSGGEPIHRENNKRIFHGVFYKWSLVLPRLSRKKIIPRNKTASPEKISGLPQQAPFSLTAGPR